MGVGAPTHPTTFAEKLRLTKQKLMIDLETVPFLRKAPNTL